MIKFRKHRSCRQLPSDTYELTGVQITVKGARYPLKIIPATDMEVLLFEYVEYGQPQYCALDIHKRLHLHPVPDKDYRAHIRYLKEVEL